MNQHTKTIDAKLIWQTMRNLNPQLDNQALGIYWMVERAEELAAERLGITKEGAHTILGAARPHSAQR